MGPGSHQRVCAAHVPESERLRYSLDILFAKTPEHRLEPEYYYNGFTEDTSFACPYGGSFTFDYPAMSAKNISIPNANSQKDLRSPATAVSITTRILTFNAKVSGDKTGTLTYTSNYNDSSATLTGEYGGETIDLSR
ncbi:MAG: hypothetical protein U0X93_07105 [Anaerolineales bacterium]